MLPFGSYSVVIPLYRSEKTIPAVVSEVAGEFARLGIERYEIILVNDCSPDNVLQVAVCLAEENERIVVVDLAKNSGQANASLAGFRQASGEVIISMDDDLQTPGTEIGRLLEALSERDDDVVFAAYDETDNARSGVRTWGTRLNWAMSRYILGRPQGVRTNSFFAMRRFVRDRIVSYAGARMYSYAIIFSTTSRISNVTVKHRRRAVGTSGYTLSKLVSIFLDGALSYSLKPMRAIGIAGGFVIIITLLLAATSCLLGRPLFSFGEAFLSIVAGIVLVCMSLLGCFAGRMSTVYASVPQYAVRKVYRREEKK